MIRQFNNCRAEGEIEILLGELDPDGVLLASLLFGAFPDSLRSSLKPSSTGYLPCGSSVGRLRLVMPFTQALVLVAPISVS